MNEHDARRVGTAAASVAAPAPVDNDAGSLRQYRDTLCDGIRAIQSTDDLGEDMNRALLAQEKLLFERLRDVESKLSMLGHATGR